MIPRFLWSFGLHLSVLLVIPLLGWGLGGAQPIFSQLGQDLLLYFQNPARLTYSILAVVAAAARGFIAVRLPLPSGVYSALPELQRWRNIAFESILVLAPFSDRRNLMVWGESPVLNWLGVVLFLTGMTWTLWAVAVYLRHEKNRLPPPAEPLLLVSGPFRRVRHPVHLGMLVYALGLVLLFRSWIGLVMLVFMLNYILMRIREEEKLGRVKYGIQWAAYIRGSWRLIPRLY